MSPSCRLVSSVAISRHAASPSRALTSRVVPPCQGCRSNGDLDRRRCGLQLALRFWGETSVISEAPLMLLCTEITQRPCRRRPAHRGKIHRRCALTEGRAGALSTNPSASEQGAFWAPRAGAGGGGGALFSVSVLKRVGKITDLSQVARPRCLCDSLCLSPNKGHASERACLWLSVAMLKYLATSVTPSQRPGNERRPRVPT